MALFIFTCRLPLGMFSIGCFHTVFVGRHMSASQPSDQASVDSSRPSDLVGRYEGRPERNVDWGKKKPQVDGMLMAEIRKKNT